MGLDICKGQCIMKGGCECFSNQNKHKDKKIVTSKAKRFLKYLGTFTTRKVWTTSDDAKEKSVVKISKLLDQG